MWPDYYVYDQNENVIDRLSEPQGGGIMFRKQMLVDVGLYDEEQLVHEDKDILIRCIEKFPGYHLKLPLYRYYRHGVNLTSDAELVHRYQQRLIENHGENAWGKGLVINPGSRQPGNAEC